MAFIHRTLIVKSMEALQTVELHRVPHSPDLEKPGDFAFIPKREPIREITRTPVYPPTGFLKTLWWTLFGKKCIEKETILPLWPEYDAVVMMCPHCNQPIGTTKDHRIVSIEPLTIPTRAAVELFPRFLPLENELRK